MVVVVVMVVTVVLSVGFVIWSPKRELHRTSVRGDGGGDADPGLPDAISERVAQG